jgi:hypothetical protein
MQSLARRFSGSSASKKQYNDVKNPVAQGVRRTLNVNHVRPRAEIKELEKVQLKRVCFVADETLISKRVYKATDPYETELPREPRLKVKDLRDAYSRAARYREIVPDDRISKAFGKARGIELRVLDLSSIQFQSREAVVPICDALSLAIGLEEVVLDNCELTDEQLRLFLTSFLCLRRQPDDHNEHNRGLARLSLAGNTDFTLSGWRNLAAFVHMVGPSNLHF